jgi:hypothetical protein
LDQQFTNFLDEAKTDEAFINFDDRQNLDKFLFVHMAEKHSKLWNAVVAKLLILSHGQATVERGFSVNKQVEVENLSQRAFVAHRVICDHIASVGGINEVVIGDDLLKSCSNARTR